MCKKPKNEGTVSRSRRRERSAVPRTSGSGRRNYRKYKRAPFWKIGRERAKRPAKTPPDYFDRLLKKRNFRDFGDFKKKRKPRREATTTVGSRVAVMLKQWF